MINTHELYFAFIAVIFVPKGHPMVFYGYDPMIGDGYFVGIPSEIFDNMLWTSERTLGIYNPRDME